MQTMLEILGVNWPFEDERRFADFTNGSSIEVIPQIYGNVDNDGWFVDENIPLKYLAIIPQSFQFELQLPEQFAGVTLMDRNCEQIGTTFSSDMHYFLFRLTHSGLDYEHGIWLNGFIFGEADSFYIVSQNNIPQGDVTEFISIVFPHCVARSNNIISTVLTPPARNQTKSVTTSIRFDSENLIQHYCGWDNQPFTNDDVLVFEPRFWDRFKVVVDQN